MLQYGINAFYSILYVISYNNQGQVSSDCVMRTIPSYSLRADLKINLSEGFLPPKMEPKTANPVMHTIMDNHKCKIYNPFMT